MSCGEVGDAVNGNCFRACTSGYAGYPYFTIGVVPATGYIGCVNGKGNGCGLANVNRVTIISHGDTPMRIANFYVVWIGWTSR